METRLKNWNIAPSVSPQPQLPLPHWIPIRLLLIFLILLGMTARPAAAQIPITLYNTGVNAAGKPVDPTLLQPDLHYKQVSPRNQTIAYVSPPYPYAWASDRTSNWITPDQNYGQDYDENGGYYTITYETTFTLSDVDMSTVSISGQWAVDNEGLDILVNGHSTGLTNNGYGEFTKFTLPTKYMVPGVNKLDFVIRDDGGPGGLNVAELVGTASPVKTTTATKLISSASSSFLNQSIILTAIISAAKGVPTGNVTFYDGKTLLGTGIVTQVGKNYQATYSTSSLLPGTHIVSAAYAGDMHFFPSTSSPVSVLVTNPVPTLISLSPQSATVGGPAFDLTLTGTNFNTSTAVHFKSDLVKPLPASLTATKMTVAIPAADIAAVGPVSITAVNSAPGGGTSNTLALQVVNPTPTITSLNPTTALLNTSGLVLTIIGKNFVPGAKINFGKVTGLMPDAKSFTTTQLKVVIPSSALASVGAVNVTVVNPFAASASNAQVFTVKSPLKPNLEVTSLTFPASVRSHDQISVNWNVQNSGPGDATQPWNDAVYLSPTVALDPKTATLLGKFSSGSALAMGASDTQTQTISLPGLSVGRYYLIVAADSDRAIAETDETDNALAMPITFVKVQALVVSPSQTALSLNIGAAQTALLALGNLSSAPMTNIKASVTGASPNLRVQVTPPSSLASLANAQAQVVVTAVDDTVLADPVTVHFTDQQGDAADAILNLSVVPNKPILTADPNPIPQGMVRGQQTLVQVTLTNTGATTAAGLNVGIPSVPWLTLVSPVSIGNLASGATAKIVLRLAPGATLPLGLYTGQIVVAGTNAALPINFAFRNISDAKGDLKIISSDEFTYFASDHPPLANAAVTLTDPATGLTVLTGTTDDQGEFAQQGVTEGNYNLEVTSPNHDAYRGSVQITAGKETDVTAFLSRQLVTYQFTVVPLGLQDQYDVELQAIFQTNVPAPVVTISPSQVDLTKLQFDKNGQAIVYLTVTNHGLIAANDVTLNLPVRPDYILTAPTTSFGTLAALSTVVVPVTVTELDLAPEALKNAMLREVHNQSIGTQSATEHGVFCSFFGKILYSYACGKPIVRSGFIEFLAKLCGGGASSGLPAPPPGTPGIFYYSNPTTITDHLICNPCYAAVLDQSIHCPAATRDVLECPGSIVAALLACPTAATNPLSLLVCVGAFAGAVWTCNSAITDTIDCAKDTVDIYKDCSKNNSGSIRLAVHADQPMDLTPTDIKNLQTEITRLQDVQNLIQVFFGASKWVNIPDAENDTGQVLVKAIVTAMDQNSDSGQRITVAEQAKIATLARPGTISTADVAEVISRWNRTLDYYAKSIFYVKQVPAGQSIDFIPADTLAAAKSAAGAAASADLADGYQNILDGVTSAEQMIRDNIIAEAQQQGTCATVNIQLDQTVAITRTAFKATLQLNNAAANVPLTKIKVALKITDEAGNDKTSLFVISAPSTSGFNAVDGTGTLKNGVTGKAVWTILPTRAAAANGTTQYFVSGEIDYTQSGTVISIPLFPTGITVVPDPYLKFHYFLQRNVYSDDPFTPQIEPTEPFDLGLLVVNSGKGTARNLTITSSQPKIIDNEKGLLVDFKLIGTQLNANPVSPSLMVDFGDIAPGGTGVADFLLTSSLVGKFISEAASFKHVDDLGNAQTSLIDSVDTHSLEHVVRVDIPTDDGKPDFLADDVPDANSLPDTLWNSEGTTARVKAITTATVDGPVSSSHRQVHLSAPATAGWAYIRIDDPAQGQLVLARVVRSDGRTIRLGDNAWTTSRLIHLQGQSLSQQNRLYIFDKDTTGSYTLNYAQKDPVDEPLGALKTLSDGTLVKFGSSAGSAGSGGSTGVGTSGNSGLSGSVAVIADFPDALYLEATDRSSGIKAVPGGTAHIGDLVTGAGIVKTGANGERYLALSALNVVGSGPILPLEITTKGFYGGDSIGYDPSTGAGQKGMAGGAGLDPVGLLAATLGKVTSASSGAVTLDDGYGRPIKAMLPGGVSAPAVGTFVAAAGPVSLEKHADGLYPVLRLRDAADLAFDLSSLQGGFLSPTNTLSVGENLFSLPGIPANPAPPSVLEAIDLGISSVLIGRLTRYDAPTQTEVFWDSAGVDGPFGSFLIGEGYRLNLHKGESGQIGFNGFRTDFADLWISLPQLGVTRIGTPFPYSVDWSQVLVTDGTRTVPLRDAAQLEFPPWLDSEAQYFDAPTQTNKTLGLIEDRPDSTKLVPWRGYWVTSMKNPLALIVPAVGFLMTTGLSPAEATVGTAFPLTIAGTQFAQGCIVSLSLNGVSVNLKPSSVTSTRVVVSINATMIAKVGAYTITVTNPLPGGKSNPQTLTVGSALIVVSLAGAVTRTHTELLVPITVKNMGTGTASIVNLTLGRLNTTAATAASGLPRSLGPLAAGAASPPLILHFPASAAPSTVRNGQVTAGGVYGGVTASTALGYTSILRVSLP